MAGVIVPVEFDVENDSYGLFINSLSQELANHPDHESNVEKYGSLISSHPLLPKQNPVQPERWMGITLSTLDPKNEKRHTTLSVRGDNVYLLGFRNQNGKWYEFGKETALDMNRQHNASHFLTGSTFLGFSSCYYELVGSSGWTDKKLGMISAREAVYELSKYNGKGRKTKLYLAKLIVMVCESARMFSYRKTVGTGWGLNTQITLTDMNQIAYLNNWENMSQAMMGWAEFTPGLRKIGIEGLEHAREVVHLILNSPKKGRKVPAVYDDPDDGRPEDGNDPSSRSGDGDGNGHPSPPGGSDGRPSHQGNDNDRLSHHGGVDGHSSNQGDGNGHQPQPTDGNEDCRLQQHVDRCQTLVEVFTLGTANSKIPFLGSITVFDGRHGQIIFWNEEKGGANSKGNFVLTGPYRGISADGRVALKIIRMAEAEPEPDVLIWDPYTEARYQYDEIITKDFPGGLKLTYAVLSSAVEANVQVDVFLFEEITVYGEITACVTLASGEVATVVLLDSGVDGKVEPVSAGSRIPLARSVLAWPVGSPLQINVECFHPVTAHEGTSSSASATIPLLFSFEHYTAKVRFKTLEGIGYVRVSVDDTREYRDEPNNSLPRSLTNEVIKENMEMSVETGSLVVHPSQLHFTLHPNKIMSCLLHLTNKSYDDYIAFWCRPGQGILKLSGILPPDSKSTYLVRTESPLAPNIGTFTITLQSCVVPEEQEDEEDVERIMETSDGMEPVVLIAKVRFSADEMTTTSEEMENTMLNKPQHTSGTTSQFKFELLKRITNNFSEESIIGCGAYGVVHKGVMDNGQAIAVKKLKYMTQNSRKQFENECTNLMEAQHPNIVRLVGYCYEIHHEYIEHEGKRVLCERSEQALCLEYMEGGSLDQYVSGKACGLDWDTCYTIIKGVCKGLDHLHKCSIFHLDLKPGNILLDTSKMPKIGDFGLSRLFSSTKTSITNTTLGTLGYTPPECIHNNEITPKYDVFSLGVLMIHIMAGRDQYIDYYGTPSKIIELVCENWKARLHETMWSRASHEVRTCIEIALTCVKSDRHERPTISKIVDDLDRIDSANFSLRHEATNLQSREPLVYNQSTNSVSMGVHDNTTEFDSMEGIDSKHAVSDEVGGNDMSMHDPMDYVHESSTSIMRNQASDAVGGHASRAISEPRDVTQTTEVDKDTLHWRNPYLRAEGNIHFTVDNLDNLFHWARFNIPSQWSGGAQQKALHDEMFSLENGLKCLMETLPAMHDLIDRAEWRSHKHRVAKLLQNLKDAVYDADDLIDEFRWYMLKVKVERNGRQSPPMDFFNNVLQGSFTKLVNSIRDRLHNISTLIQNMGLPEVTRFDKSVRPETSSFPDETRIFGRDMELNKIIEILCKPSDSSSANPKRQRGNSAVDVSTSTSASNQVSSKSSITDVNVLPIVGIGGVGKTTLAQHIYSNAQVKSHFDLRIWVCVSDDFDVKRLTKEVIESCSGKQATTENLSSLQTLLSNIVSSKRFLIVLDDMWDDALKENGMCWKRFCAPLKNMLHGSVMLVTTRSQKVADGVGTMDTITLEGLKDDVFWNFFKLCAFESDSLNNNDPELERIGRSIVPKLRGSPLAAKTLGRILRMNLQAEYWNAILDSELWELRQEDNEILPALRLSYIYLPFHLKRCFSLCAVYPKDYKFQKVALAEIWVAEGFVEPQGGIPVQDIASEYFNELSYRSFFQEIKGGYVIHDLLHDMAQKVSEFDCFIVKRRTDFKNIPSNVRHLSIHSSPDIDYSNLFDLCHFTKLRTLLCNKPSANKKDSPRLMAAWCSELQRLRVIVLASIHELPANIDNLKHLRYLKISRVCPFKSLPSEFYRLYNLQSVCLQKCKLESLPTDFSKLICLQRFQSNGFLWDAMFIRFQGEELYYKVSVSAGGLRLIKNMNQLSELVIHDIFSPISKEHAAEAQLHNKKYLEKLNLKYRPLLRNPVDSYIEVRFLQPLASIKSLLLQSYQGVTLPSWSQPDSLPRLMLSLISCDGLESSSVPSITDLIIDGCENLSSLEHVIHPAYIPSIKKLAIKNCKKLVSVPAERFGDLRCLEELEVHGCPSIDSQSLVAPSLKRLVLGIQNEWNFDPSCGNLADNVDCCSLTYFFLSCNCLTSIQLQKWNLPALEELHIARCTQLTSIIGQSGQVIGGTGGDRAFKSLTSLTIGTCYRLSTIDSLLAEEYLPAIERIHVSFCLELVSLPGERFGNFSSLKELEISYCYRLSWMRGFVLPSSLQILHLHDCGDFSAWFPSCLQNLASLVTLKIIKCQRITSIPGNLWSTNRTSLENLMIQHCPDIVSIGGKNAISEIKNVSIDVCPKLEEIKQPMLSGSYLES